MSEITLNIKLLGSMCITILRHFLSLILLINAQCFAKIDCKNICIKPCIPMCHYVVNQFKHYITSF